MQVSSGKIELTTPGQAVPFELVTSDAALSDLQESKVYVVANTSGTEVVVAEGSLSVVSRGGADGQGQAPGGNAITLQAEQLAHAFVNAGGDLAKQPTVMVAHGGGKYLGQVLSGSVSHQVSTPEELEEYLRGFRTPADSTSDTAEAQTVWSQHDQIFQFNRMFRRIQNESVQNRVDQFERRYSFQGEITIDGRRIQFSSAEEFRNFQRRLKERNRP